MQIQAPTKNEVLKCFAEHVRTWLAAMPARAGEIRGRICERLKLREDEFETWIGVLPRLQTPATPSTAEKEPADGMNLHWPRQRAPLGAPPVGAEFRAVLSNFETQMRYEADVEALKADGATDDEVGEFKRLARAVAFQYLKNEDDVKRFEELKNTYAATLQPVTIARNLDVIVTEINRLLNGWPMACARRSYLFVDDGREMERADDAPVLEIRDAKEFKTFLHAYFRKRFATGIDVDRVNFVSEESVFIHMLANQKLWSTVTPCPHEPPIEGHYYACKPPNGYTPAGEHLAALIRMFDNVRDKTSRAIMAASFVAPFWGGPLGSRPGIACVAKTQGSGKSTLMFAAAELAGDVLSVDFDDPTWESELKKRLLSGEGRSRRCIAIDNITKVFRSALVASLFTCHTISGRELNVGEGSRPNDIQIYLSMNNARLDSDASRRVFYIECHEPIKKVRDARDWEATLRRYQKDFRQHIIWDCIEVLRQTEKEIDYGNFTGEKHAFWVEGVLAKTMNYAPVMTAIMDHEELESSDDVTVLDVLVSTHGRRDECNTEIGEAREFIEGLLEVVARNRGWIVKPGIMVPRSYPDDPKGIFIRTTSKQEYDDNGHLTEDARNNMCTYWKNIFQVKNDMSAKVLVPILDAHLDAGRFDRRLSSGEVVRVLKKEKAESRGYLMRRDVMVEWLNEYRARIAKDASEASNVSGCNETSDASDASDASL